MINSCLLNCFESDLLMANLNEKIIKNLSLNASTPLVLRGFVNNWPIRQWNLEKWCLVFGDKELPFRSMKKDFICDEPFWERRCDIQNMSFKEFMDSVPNSENWMYFDYKHLQQWFPNDEELLRSICWKDFGYPEKGAKDSTLWVGSYGAHTPAHQDTYGVNIVTQLYGRKRWLLFPPEIGGIRPTRVPYEESSVYSELNFFCPNNVDAFIGLTGGRMVELSAGDALLVPRGWWHYVQNLDPINIALNVWIPHEKDLSAHISEALTKIIVAQICKNLPEDTVKLIINPNEDDLLETPLAVLFLQLETVAKTFLDNRRKSRRVKRQRTCEETQAQAEVEEYDLRALLDNPANRMETAPSVTSLEIIEMIRNNKNEFIKVDRPLDDDEWDAATNSLCLTKALIDAFSENNAIEAVKHNLLTRLSGR